MVRKLVAGAVAVLASMAFFGAAFAAETDFGNAKGFGWQERARVCVALTEEQCTAVVQLQTGGGDGSGAGASSGDAGAGSSGSAGSSGGSGGNGCGPR